MRIQSQFGQLLYPELPIFYAASAGTGTNGVALGTSAAEITIFTNVAINRGNHYNSSTCRFTAPVAGIYEFGLQMIAGNANDVYRFGFIKNGANQNPQLRLDTSDATNTDYETGTMVVYYDLLKGDAISVYGYSNAGNDKFSNITYDIFRGRLIG